MQTVILIPGLAADGAMWAAQRDALAPVYDVRVSDVHFKCETLPAMAAALLAEHPGPLVPCGASMGGIVA
ncbi:MAG: alpha/beta hydrolase, partial [Burkholderiales bacterium]